MDTNILILSAGFEIMILGIVWLILTVKNSSKIERLTDKIARLDPLENYIGCEECKCWGLKEDFKCVNILEKPYFGTYHIDSGQREKFYCQKCKPDYDEVDRTDYKNPKYYKTVAEHKEQIKVKVN